MVRSKYSAAFKALSKKAVFSVADGRALGIPPRMLAYFCTTGQIERVTRGVYKLKDVDFGSEFEWEDLTVAALSVPNGIICLLSALCYYGLTDEIMREFWIAIPHSSTVAVRENVLIFRMRNISLGKTTIKIGNQNLKIFDRERTIVDAFRFLDQETALKALRAYLTTDRSGKPDINKLLKYAKRLRVNLIPYISAFAL